LSTVALETLRSALDIPLAAIAYVGDDLPDLSAIRAAGLGIAVANAMPVVAAHAAHTTTRCGGDGAVREVCELIMRAQGTLDAIVERYR
jgi:3-deoxy-D-manno-octulosonate 8-phosphate phosphatase (KDO 8-P phosphatase)